MNGLNDLSAQKIRIGIALGELLSEAGSPAELLRVVDDCERWEIDSIWVSDRIAAPQPTPEPVVLLSFLASRLKRMKLGTSALVLPTRQPVTLAKELATLDLLSEGRLLLVAGLGADDSRDFEATGVPREERGRRADEAIALMKRLWTEENVTFRGRFWSTTGLTLVPRPYRREGIPLWTGGRSPAALRRAGRLADGWLASRVTPREIEAGIQAIRVHAAAAGRCIPGDHYGALVPFCFAKSVAEASACAAQALRDRPDAALGDYAALGPPERVREKLEEYVRAGATKFVMRPAGPKGSARDQIKTLAETILPVLQTPA
ncbi:MAG TPA: LLM class flavin-dependent oxidoreductase [candidate division Zixibacteria bacterium]|nr:LLM class flavin-dependent oxidoreductase [candidate division Zixibacteria bacterium]